MAQHKLDGLSLIELLVAMVIVGILALVSFPSLHALFNHRSQQVAVDRLIKMIHFARIEAAQMQVEVVLCGSSDKLHCDGEWNKAQLLVQLRNGEAKVLRAFDFSGESLSLRYKGSFGRNDALAFSPSGFAKQQGSFYLCAMKSEHPNCTRIVVLQTGRARVAP